MLKKRARIQHAREERLLHEHPGPLSNLPSRFRRYFFHTLNHLFQSPCRFKESCLRIELVGKTDKLFFYCLGDKILYRQFPSVRHHLLFSKSCTCVSFTYSRMTLISTRTQQLGSKIAMTEIRLTAITIYTRSIGEEYAQIMQHCSLFHKLHVNIQFGMPARHFKSKFRHFHSVNHVNIFQFIIFRVIAVDNSLYINFLHLQSLFYPESKIHFLCNSTKSIGIQKSPICLKLI